MTTRTKAAPAPLQLPGRPIRLSARGRLPVVSASPNYGAGIDQVIGGRQLAGRGDWEGALVQDAFLVPEPNNRHDRHAIRVDMAAGDGHLTVGYISRENAQRYQPALMPLTARGLLPTCPGRLIESGGRGAAVYLHVADPDELTFANEPGNVTLLEPERELGVADPAGSAVFV